jgi:hypothetical protein
MRWAGFACEEKALSHGGKQHIMTKGTETPLLFNGEQTFFLFKETKESDTKLPKVAITSKVPHEAWTMALERNSVLMDGSFVRVFTQKLLYGLVSSAWLR